MMAVALQIPCITRHYYPSTLENLKKIAQAAGIGYGVNEASTCCGLPFFEKGELKTAKSCGEYNLSIYRDSALLCLSSKCESVFKKQYPRIFNNTVSHNDAVHLAKNAMGLRDIIDKIPASLLQAVRGSYFMVTDCCSDGWIRGLTPRLSGADWKFPALQTACCGAGTSLPASDHQLAGSMSLSLIGEFLSSGASAMVFEDDICRRQTDLAASANNIIIKSMNIADLIASAIA